MSRAEDIQKFIRRFLSQMPFEPASGEQPHACFCVGPQDGQPVCPCRMRNVRVIDGRYVEIHDLGPAE